MSKRQLIFNIVCICTGPLIGVGAAYLYKQVVGPPQSIAEVFTATLTIVAIYLTFALIVLYPLWKLFVKPNGDKSE